MKTRVVARRYAEAFFQVMQGKQMEEIYQDFRIFASFADGTSEFAVALRHPALRYEKKEKLVRAFLAEACSPRIGEFILLLLKRHRFSLFSLIVEEVERLYKKAKSIVNVQVKSAVPLTQDELKLLVEKLNRRVQGTVELNEVIDPQVRGGLLLCFEDKVLDSSIRTKLKLLRERMSTLSTELLQSIESTPTQLL